MGSAATRARSALISLLFTGLVVPAPVMYAQSPDRTSRFQSFRDQVRGVPLAADAIQTARPAGIGFEGIDYPRLKSLAELRAAVAAGSVRDPALHRPPPVAQRTRREGAAAAGIGVPVVTAQDLFFFEDTEELLTRNFSFGELSDLMIRASNALLAEHGDNFDFVAFFLNFDAFSTIGSAFHQSIENDVTGIGSRGLFNDRATRGLAGDNIESWVMMWNLHSWPTGPGSITQLVLAQEFEHRFAMFLDPLPGDRRLQGANMGCGRSSHWNWRVDGQGSGMEMRNWVGSSPATLSGNRLTFNTDTGGAFSVPDLYLMGYVSPAEMDALASELRYMDASPSCGSPYSGPISTWSSADVIATNGLRVPDSSTAQKDFSTGWIILHLPGAEPTSGEVGLVIDILNHWNDAWIAGTLSRGTMNNTLFRDCNNNGIDDATDVLNLTSPDCNGNVIPDECEPAADCNANGKPDFCDLLDGGSRDCNANAVPDECDIFFGVSADTNIDAVPDECEAPVLFVNDSATGLNHGTSWADAYRDLQDALRAAAVATNVVTEIWVAGGTYTPDSGTMDRRLTFQLADGVGLFGGFAGNETIREQRDPGAHVTTLTGDLNSDDGPDVLTMQENSLHVVGAEGLDASAVLDGFVVSGGNADGAADAGRGGGMLVVRGAPTITDCRFERNRAREGGGLHIRLADASAVTACTFIDNVAVQSGGGLFIDRADPEVHEAAFTSNVAGEFGGGVAVRGGGPVFADVTLSQNEARDGGGMAVLADDGTLAIADCRFVQNIARGLPDSTGGGLLVRSGGGPRVLRCTFDENRAAFGGGVGVVSGVLRSFVNCRLVGNAAINAGDPRGALGGGLFLGLGGVGTVVSSTFQGNSANTAGGAIAVADNSSLSLADSIAWGDVAPLGSELKLLGGSLSVRFSNVMGGPEGANVDTGAALTWDEGNLDADPLFARASVRLSPGSPCIDAGENLALPQALLTDLDGGARFVDDPATADTGAGSVPVIDLGAYEFGSLDCDFDGVPNVVEIADGTMADCTSNGLPDACELDCNATGTADSCDVAFGLSPDCAGNGVPDECEADCDENGVPDVCEGGGETDCNGDGVPDGCQQILSEPVVATNRYLSFQMDSVGGNQAVRVRFIDLPEPFNVFEGRTMWIQAPATVTESPGNISPSGVPGEGTFTAATLGCRENFENWSAFGTVFVYHELIVPGSVYELRSHGDGCESVTEAAFTLALTVSTGLWGDVSGAFDAALGAWTQPDGRIDVTVDVVSILDKFAGRAEAPRKVRVDLEPARPDRRINITDVTAALDAFSGRSFPFGPGSVPPC